MDAEVDRAQEFLHFMAATGFVPREARTKGTLEFHKTYSDPSGRVGRATAVVRKDITGLVPESIEYFPVTVQTHVGPTETEVLTKAPSFCKHDLLHIVNFFAPKTDRRDATTEECELCGIITADFAKRKDGALVCLDCARRKGL